jgi:PleD family two-component response regulator
VTPLEAAQNFLQFAAACATLLRMSKPLALVYYSNLLPGTQLANRLQDLGYRVQSLNSVAAVVPACERDKPLVLIAELSPPDELCAAVAQLKSNPATKHISVLAFAQSHDDAIQAKAREAGVSLLAGAAAIAEHLPQLLEQILHVD